MEKGEKSEKDKELAPILARKYPDFFAQDINTQSIKHTVEHYVVTKGPPVASRLRRLSPEKREFVQEEIEKLFQAGIITPSSSPYTLSWPEKVSHGRRLPGAK